MSPGNSVKVWSPGGGVLSPFEVTGSVLDNAPFSVQIAYVDRNGVAREDWFRLRGSIRHGDTNEEATRFTVVC